MSAIDDAPTQSRVFDYDKVARKYDRHRRQGGPFLPALLRLAKKCAATRVIEIGAGTGNNTGAFKEGYPCELIGVDLSMGMLEQARKKVDGATWVNADAQSLPLRSGSAKFIFGVLVLHHVADPVAVFRECYRALNRGAVGFVTASHSFIERHPMNRYFPSFAAIDKQRFQPVEDLVAGLRAAGFSRVSTEDAIASPKPIDEEFIEKVADKFISTYALIPEDEFAAGLDQLKTDVAKNGRLDAHIVWESVVISGWKE